MNSTPLPESVKPDRSESERVFWLSFGLALLSWFSIKMVLPALPGLTNALHTSSSGIKLSVSIYLIFFAFSQPFWAAVSQRTGYRRALYYSLIVTLLGSFIAIISFNLPLYIVGRTLEGIGMGASAPIAKTLLVNYFDRKTLSVRVGIISGTAATMPALAPIFAGYLLLWINWQAIFGTFFLMTAILFYFIHRLLPQNNSSDTDQKELTSVEILKSNFAILRQSAFWGYTFPYAMSMGGLLGYYSAMPFWYHVQLHIPEHNFAYFAVPTVGMYVFGLLVSGWFIKKNSIESIIMYGALLSVVVTFFALVLAVFNTAIIISIIVIMSLFGFTAGLISPNANAGVLMQFKQLAAPTLLPLQ